MNHLNQIREQLAKYDIEAMLVTGEAGEHYAVNFHGEGVVLVTEAGSWYYTDSRYIESAEKQITDCNIAMTGNGKNHIALAAEEMAKQGVKRVGIQEDCMSLQEYRTWVKALSADVELVDAGDLVNELRASKDADEMKLMREAQAITDKTFLEILNHIRPGETEQEIAAKITYYQMKFGGEKNSFDPIVVSGPKGSLPHGIPGAKEIQAGEFVTMDFGCMVGGYCSDMTRTVAVGQPTEEMEKVYNIVLKAQLAGIAAAKAGVIGADVDEVARNIIREAGYGDYFGHGLGHSLGLEIHENPNFNARWKRAIPAGAVLSVEPGIYLPGKMGVRIEDVVWLQEGGCEVLTKSEKKLIIL